MNQEKTKHNTIEKALVMLCLFTEENRELSTTEISKLMGYHKATTSRILLLLTRYDYLEQNEQNKKFKLGAAIVNLSVSAKRSLNKDLAQIAKPYIDELRNTLQETVMLQVLSGKNTVRTYIADGSRRIRLTEEIGSMMPPNVSVGAKAILAFSAPRHWDLFLDGKLTRYTPNSITDPNVYKKELEKIKKSGLAFDRGEYDADFNAIGAPVFDVDGKPIAAVVVVSWVNHMKDSFESKFSAEVKKTAGDISKRLYYTPNTSNPLKEILSFNEMADLLDHG